MVAAHARDCHGASRAGLVTGWVSRLEKEHSPVLARPDVTGGDLTEVALALLDLTGGRPSPLAPRTYLTPAARAQ